MTNIQTNLDGFFNKENDKIRIYNFRELCKEIPNTSYITHNIHKYPAKFIPQIPRYFIKKYTIKGDWVLDPFGGCGTTVLEANILNRNSSMIELNPLGCLIAKVCTTPLNIKKIKQEFAKMKTEISRHKEEDIETDFPNINHWFDKKIIKELEIIKNIINLWEDNSIKNFFKVGFSSIIREVSKADPKIAAPLITKRMKKVFKMGRKIDTFKTFIQRIEDNIFKIKKFTDLIQKHKNPSIVEIFNQDARTPLNKDKEYDLVITSPPYINAQEYIRIHKIEMYWLDLIDYDKKINLEKTLIGTEKSKVSEYNDLYIYGIEELDKTIEEVYKKDKKRAYTIYKFYKDMDKVIKNIHKSLKNKGIFILVIGNNNIRQVQIKNHLFLKELGLNNNFLLKSIGYDEIKARSLMTKRRVTEEFMDREWVLFFKKS